MRFWTFTVNVTDQDVALWVETVAVIETPVGSGCRGQVWQETAPEGVDAKTAVSSPTSTMPLEDPGATSPSRTSTPPYIPNAD